MDAAALKQYGGFDYAEEVALSPLQKLYFSGDMFSKYEPANDALRKLVDTEGEDEDAWDEFENTFDKFMDFSWCSNWGGKKYDIIFYGVSGYTGYLMMEYLKRTALKRNPEKFTFAFAGRTPSKVAEMRDREFMGTPYEDTEILRCSYDDIVSVIDMVKSAHCIVNVAGPYMLAQGENLIDACCYMGTHYCDVSGEIPWTLRTMDLHKHAQKGNAIIAPSSAVAGAYPDLCVKAMYDKLKGDLQCAVTACGCATKPKEPAAKKEAAAETPAGSAHALPAPVVPEPEPERELTFAQRVAKASADDFLTKAPATGVVRYTFNAQGRLGIRLSRDVPPWILEVADGTLAAKKAPRVPVGGVVLAVNGYELAKQDDQAAIEGLAKRPVILDIEWPTDQSRPSVNRA